MQRPTASSGDGSAFIVGLLLVCLVLVAVLTWQAQDAAVSHRAMAEDVLRDYARLAADEFVRRSVNQVGFYGYYKILTALKRTADMPPSHRALVADADAATRRAVPLARYIFAIDPATRRLEWSQPSVATTDGATTDGATTDGATTGGATTDGSPTDRAIPSQAIRTWLYQELEVSPESTDEAGPAFIVRHPVIDGRLHSFVFTTSQAADGTINLVGFEVDLTAQTEWFEYALGRGPLLPASLTKSVGEEDFLLLSVTDATGQERFRAGRPERLSPERLPHAGSDPGAEAEFLSVEVPYGDRYEGIFQGTTVRVSLYPETAARLVIGGLPRSRLPTLVGLLLLTTGLLVAAIIQLRRSRDLTRLRADFVSRVSHELRTPLTQIRMFAETLILGRVRSDDERSRSLRIIDQEARRLSHLVENILQFSRSERGAMRLTPQPHQLAPLIRALLRDFEPLLGGRQVTFVIQPADDATVAVDSDAMRQILLNLLDNAVKYGPPQQQVRIGIENGTDALVRLRIEDEGPGIPPAERQRIWRSFHRLQRDRRSAVAGTGIGLAVVRELVALQGGQVGVEAGSRGGARFVIELPRVDEIDPAGAPTGASEVPA